MPRSSRAPLLIHSELGPVARNGVGVAVTAGAVTVTVTGVGPSWEGDGVADPVADAEGLGAAVADGLGVAVVPAGAASVVAEVSVVLGAVLFAETGLRPATASATTVAAATG